MTLTRVVSNSSLCPQHLVKGALNERRNQIYERGGEVQGGRGAAVLWSSKQIPCPCPFEVSVSTWLGVECNVPSPSPLLEPQESLAPHSRSVVATAQARPPNSAHLSCPSVSFHPIHSSSSNSRETVVKKETALRPSAPGQ